jgi:SET domain-containing protein
MTKKDKLLKDLHHHTFAMLKPSSLHGIGVFAVTAIKKGEQKIFSSHEAEWIEVSKEEVDALPPHAKDLVENHCLFNETHYYIPEYGFKVFDLAVYLNHSEQPNLISINDGEFFEAICDIEAGEELLIDYGTIVESEE